jgi:hypothetical protein
LLIRLLMLLLLWPLLLPPGVCLCQPGKLGFRAPVADSITEKEPCCPCCRHETAEPTSPDSLDQPDRPTDETPHAPTCPAHPSWKSLCAAKADPAPSLDDAIVVTVPAVVARGAPALPVRAAHVYLSGARLSAPASLHLRC